jgi:hypothetical protein
MLQELKKFILGFPDNFGFELNNEVFLQGLKFSCQESYPWKNGKQRRHFFDRLYAHETADSYQKILEWTTVFYHEQTHICYSKGLILRLSSLMMISSGLILIALQLALPSLVFACTGILMLVGDVWFRRRGSKNHETLIMMTILLNMLTDQALEKEELRKAS